MNNINQKIPAVGTLINTPEIRPLIASYGRELVIYAIRKTVDNMRSSGVVEKGISVPESWNLRCTNRFQKVRY